MKRVSCISICVCAFLLLGACMHVHAALPGTTCRTAIPLGDNYSAQVAAGKTIWYTAWTFDLPLTVKFIPQSPTDLAPDVEMDFTCTPGVYTDSILCSLFCPTTSGSGIDFDMPHHPNLSSKTENGEFFYYLAMGKTYRDLLLKTGIDYNVQVFVKVTFKSAGTISLVPDAFSNCMDGPKFMHLGDTVKVKTRDKNRHVIVPYVQWQDDSIRYVWNGTAPVTLAVGNECSFDPTDNGDESILDFVTLQPQDTLKMTSDEVQYYIHSGEVSSEAGMFFAKFYTDGTGTMKIERVPQAPPKGGAKLLQYDKKTTIPSDTNLLYAMPYTWDTATLFTTPTDHIFKMYVSTTHDFYLPDAIATYQFSANDAGHWLGLTSEQMHALWAQTNEKYLYVRFECSANTTLTPTIWDVPACFVGTTVGGEIKRPGATVSVEKGSYGAKYYRFYYREWRGGDMKFQWSNSSGTCPTYIGKNCSFPTIATNDDVITNKTIAKNGTWTVDAEEVAEWAEYVDEDGYLYIRFNPGNPGKMKITTTAPEELDSPCNPYDSVLTVTAWDEYIWRGTQYVSGGEYVQNGLVNPETGCVDTVYTLQLTIRTTHHSTYEATECDSIVYQDKTYTQSGEYADTIYDAMGNRTIMTLSFTVHPSKTAEETKAACHSYTWHEMTYTESGEYRDTLQTVTGCDSICILHLTINQPTTGEVSETACVSYTWHDETYTSSGDYVFHTTNAAGCDSTVTLHLTINNPTTGEVTETACDSYTWHEQTYTSSGDYEFHTTNAAGCDSTVTLHLTIHQSTTGEVSQTAIGSYTWHDETYTASGDYEFHTTNVAGCDSTVTLHLTINNPTSGEVTESACISYTWHGETYTESGDYEFHTTNVAGSDSTVTLHLTIHQPTTGEVTEKACNSYTWHEQTYTSSGDYEFHTTNVAGCDSTVTLHLTISNPTTGELTERACESYTWHDETYTASGDYEFHTTNVAGCDSTVTLHLTIHQPTTGELTETACNSFAWHGDIYTTSGDYLFHTTNVAGCDSAITLHLTINECLVDYDTVYFCAGQNTEHEEMLSETQIRRYIPYAYESPSEWDYMEGVILARERDRMQVDLVRAEQNLRNHYTNGLTPVKSVVWSYRPDGETGYQALDVTAEPQWIATGTIAVSVRFVCGQMYTSDFECDIVPVSDDQSGTSEKKVLENGQIMIIRGGAKYSVLGIRIQ